MESWRVCISFPAAAQSARHKQNHTGDDQRYQRCAEADAQVGAVGDGADDLRGKGVAEEVNAEEVDGDGGGADGRGDGVDDGGVQRAGVEEEEELGGEERREWPRRGGRRRAGCRRAAVSATLQNESR